MLERVNVRSIRPALLDRLHGNDAALAAGPLRDPAVPRRDRVALDRDSAWRLDTGEPVRTGREVTITAGPAGARPGITAGPAWLPC